MMDGFWAEDVNPFGPVQLKVADGILDAVNESVAAWHTGEFLPTVGDAGIAFTTTPIVAGRLLH
jgi:hypothetical protein